MRPDSICVEVILSFYTATHIAAPVGLKKQFTKTSPTSVNITTADRCLSGPLRKKHLGEQCGSKCTWVNVNHCATYHDTQPVFIAWWRPAVKRSKLRHPHQSTKQFTEITLGVTCRQMKIQKVLCSLKKENCQNNSWALEVTPILSKPTRQLPNLSTVSLVLAEYFNEIFGNFPYF